MAQMVFDITDRQAEQLKAAAERLGLAPEDFVRAVVADVLAQPDPDFAEAANGVLEKNRELYRRLA